LVVSNHLGDADFVVGTALPPVVTETLAKAELYDYPVLGKVLDAYGVIWVHRGQPDRKALRAALDGLRQGKLVSIAPEGRESVTGALEEGTQGAAYLALKAGVPLLPVTFTGTENARIYGNLKRLRRTDVTMTVGPLFRLDDLPDHKQAIEQGTQKIMYVLAAQLPPEYRGMYGSPDAYNDKGQAHGD
jgi:1-acyl-sn-glycerol-3-phosphate acyltransferase